MWIGWMGGGDGVFGARVRCKGLRCGGWRAGVRIRVIPLSCFRVTATTGKTFVWVR